MADYAKERADELRDLVRMYVRDQGGGPEDVKDWPEWLAADVIDAQSLEIARLRELVTFTIAACHGYSQWFKGQAVHPACTKIRNHAIKAFSDMAGTLAAHVNQERKD